MKDGDVIIKGGALKSRGLEKFQRVFLEEMIKLIMQEKPETVAIYEINSTNSGTANWKIDMLMKIDTLQDSLDKYRAKIAGSAAVNRAAAVKLPRWPAVAITDPATRSVTTSKPRRRTCPASTRQPASELIPENRDENVDYYIAKLDDLMKKFSGLDYSCIGPKTRKFSLIRRYSDYETKTSIVTNHSNHCRNDCWHPRLVFRRMRLRYH